MKKKILIGLVGCFLAFSLVACGGQTTVNVNVENNNELSSITLGINSLVSIGDGLWYDSATRIVYWWNGNTGYDEWTRSYSDTIPSPYYAPNGLPYRYNPETNTFEEIKNINEETFHGRLGGE